RGRRCRPPPLRHPAGLAPRVPGSPAVPGGDDGCLDPRDGLVALPAPRARVHAWLALQAHAAFDPVAARAALERSGGDPAAALRALGAGPPHAVLDAAALAAACAALVRVGARLLPYGAALYPARLAALADPPPLLAVRGDPRAL